MPGADRPARCEEAGPVRAGLWPELRQGWQGRASGRSQSGQLRRSDGAADLQPRRHAAVRPARGRRWRNATAGQ
ncbi:hypothetical protein G6F35_018415 [Rhizopus arrhizus]|nr:hypothetical protein G6F35_018415 [Rhizopus arrhizus]